jgi:hypothetical protein
MRFTKFSLRSISARVFLHRKRTRHSQRERYNVASCFILGIFIFPFFSSFVRSQQKERNESTTTTTSAKDIDIDESRFRVVVVRVDAIKDVIRARL